MIAINSIFGKEHSLDAKVIFLDKEQVISHMTYMDQLIQIEDCRYHMEFQTLEGNMEIRMYEYAVNETMTDITERTNAEDGEYGRYELDVVMPEQTVIFLAGSNKKNRITVNLTLPDRQRVTYTLPCISVSRTVEELIGENLYLFIPFQQVQLNQRFTNLNLRSREETRHRLARELVEYHKTAKYHLTKLKTDGIITVSECERLLEALSNVENYLRKKDEAVDEEVQEIMGDEDYIAWSDQLRAEGKELGIEQGIGLGIEQGEMISLIRLTIRKLQKGQSIERIADDLEVSADEIREIAEVIKESAPDADERTIYDRLQQLQKV